MILSLVIRTKSCFQHRVYVMWPILSWRIIYNWDFNCYFSLYLYIHSKKTDIEFQNSGRCCHSIKFASILTKRRTSWHLISGNYPSLHRLSLSEVKTLHFNQQIFMPYSCWILDGLSRFKWYFHWGNIEFSTHHFYEMARKNNDTWKSYMLYFFSQIYLVYVVVWKAWQSIFTLIINTFLHKRLPFASKSCNRY